MTQVRFAALGDVCAITTGGTPARTRRDFFGGGIPWVKIGDMVDGVVRTTEETISQAGIEGSSAKLFSRGTVLISIFATIGRTAILEIDAATNQAIAGITPYDSLESAYLRYFLDSKHRELNALARGVAQPNINQKILKSLRIPLPPIAEQRRIVDLLSRAEGILRLRREAQRKAAELIPAIFLDLFGDPATNPKGWPVFGFGDLIIEGPQNGLYKHKSCYGTGTPILRIDGFYDGVVQNLASLQRVRIEPDEAQRFGLTQDDIVINRVNSPEYLGKSALIPALAEAMVFESNMMRLHTDPARMAPKYMIALLQTEAIRSQILARAKHAINQSSINQQDVRAFRVPLPPLDLQRQFAAKGEAVRSIIARQTAALATAQATFDALLHRVFAQG